MAIAARTSTATSAAAGTTGFTLVINSAVVAGDILLCGVTNRDATADPTVVDNDSGTWLKVHNQNATTNGAITVWWRRATSATASKTITVSGCTGSASGGVTPYSGALAAGTPYGTPVGETNASGNETQAGITTARPGSFVCLFVGLTSNDTLDVNTVTATNPTALTDRFEGVSTSGSDCSMAHASAVRTTAGATGAISWLQTDGTGASVAFELIIADTIATVAHTQASDTNVITGTVPALASVAATQAADTNVVTATVPALAVSSHIQSADTNVITVTVADAGSNAAVSLTQANDTTALTATSAVAAAVSTTQASDTNVITATVPASAAVTHTQAADAVAATTTVRASAVVAHTQAADIVAAETANRASVSVSISQGADSATGDIVTVAVNLAAIAVTQASDAVVASASVPVLTSSALVVFSQAADFSVITATAAIAAAVAFTQADDGPIVLPPTGTASAWRSITLVASSSSSASASLSNSALTAPAADTIVIAPATSTLTVRLVTS